MTCLELKPIFSFYISNIFYWFRIDTLFILCLGFASVNLENILKSNSDIIDDDFIVKDLRCPGSIVGKLNISVEALDLLCKIKQELDTQLQTSNL